MITVIFDDEDEKESVIEGLILQADYDCRLDVPFCKQEDKEYCSRRDADNICRDCILTHQEFVSRLDYEV